MLLKYKTIPLTKGFETIVDAEDYDWLTALGKWTYLSTGYAYKQKRTKETGDITYLMHRLILSQTIDLKKGACVDHINRDRLDNRKENLRLMPNGTMNNGNRGVYSNNKTGYRGVRKFRNKYQASLQFEGIMQHLGTFAAAEEASQAYEAKAKELWGEFLSPLESL